MVDGVDLVDLVDGVVLPSWGQLLSLSPVGAGSSASVVKSGGGLDPVKDQPQH